MTVALWIEDSGLNPVQRTVADGATISKMTLCKLTDPNTAAEASGAADVFGGIAAAEKVASDGSTTLACHMNGVFGITMAAATCTIGEQMTNSGVNLVRPATEAEVQLGQWLGYAEDAGSAAEVIRVRLRGG